MIDKDGAMLDPTMVFKDPKDVVGEVELTRDQKIEILRRWGYDARQLEVAEEEGMAGGQASDVLERVLSALQAFGAGPELKQTPPTK